MTNPKLKEELNKILMAGYDDNGHQNAENIVKNFNAYRDSKTRGKKYILPLPKADKKLVQKS